MALMSVAVECWAPYLFLTGGGASAASAER